MYVHYVLVTLGLIRVVKYTLKVLRLHSHEPLVFGKLWGVWNTFAEIHSGYPPRCIDSQLGQDFLLLSCLHVRSRNALLNIYYEVRELDGYNHDFWKTSAYFLKCVLELVASPSHAKVPSKAPHSTELSQTSSKT